MLRTLDIRHDSFPLSEPFRISRGVKTVAEVITVSIRQGSLTGRGEGVPYPRYGETIERALTETTSLRDAIERGASREQLAGLIGPGAARNALDCALWDLEAQLSGVSVAARLQRPDPARCVSALTIGIDTLANMAARASAFASAPLLKVKVDRTSPAEQVRAVREAAPRARLIVDPNESWTMCELQQMQDCLREADVALLEQPLPANRDGDLDGFVSSVPICADESLHVASDLDGLVGRYQVVNVKLDKTGGLTHAVSLVDAARERGFSIMLGCMICSSLSIAPILHLATDADFIDLDGPLWLLEDYPSGVRDAAGHLSAPARGFWGSGRGAAIG